VCLGRQAAGRTQKRVTVGAGAQLLAAEGIGIAQMAATVLPLHRPPSSSGRGARAEGRGPPGRRHALAAVRADICPTCHARLVANPDVEALLAAKLSRSSRGLVRGTGGLAAPSVPRLTTLCGMGWSGRDTLRDRVAVVAGATRGAGRGIAAALGEAGATVICTGRSSRTGTLRSDYDRPETIEETAELVTKLGGSGVASVVDHLDPDQVRRLADEIRADHGHIDVLVNDIWGAEQLKGGPAEWNTPIWELDLNTGLRILRLAVDTHLITSHHLLPLLIDQPGGLLVEVTDGTADYNRSRYRLSVFYDLGE
jgi:hypothetical protein